MPVSGEVSHCIHPSMEAEDEEHDWEREGGGDADRDDTEDRGDPREEGISVHWIRLRNLRTTS